MYVTRPCPRFLKVDGKNMIPDIIQRPRKLSWVGGGWGLKVEAND